MWRLWKVLDWIKFNGVKLLFLIKIENFYQKQQLHSIKFNPV